MPGLQAKYDRLLRVTENKDWIACAYLEWLAQGHMTGCNHSQAPNSR